MPYVDVSDTIYYYEDEGTGDTLLFLHGWGTSGRAWDAQLPEFVTDHRVVTVDWRGCGRSAHPAEGNTIDGVTADLADFVRVTGLERPVLVGSSIGAVFATELALRRPELVGGVIAVGMPGHWAGNGTDLRGLHARLRRDRVATLADWVPTWYAPDASPALRDLAVRQVLQSGVYIDAQFDGAVTYDPRPGLPSLRVPAHYVHGELDAGIPLEVPRTYAALAPGAGLIVVPNAGHMPHQERPEEFNTALRTALASLCRTTAPATSA